MLLLTWLLQLIKQIREMQNFDVYAESSCLFCFALIFTTVLTLSPIIFLSSTLPEPYGEYTEIGYVYYMIYDFFTS